MIMEIAVGVHVVNQRGPLALRHVEERSNSLLRTRPHACNLRAVIDERPIIFKHNYEDRGGERV